MYKIRKENGTTSHVLLVNTDTMAEVNLGNITPTLISIIGKEGYHIITGHVTPEELLKDKHLTLSTKWDITISNETKAELVRYALPAKVPHRKAVEEEKPEQKPIVDVLDLIYNIKKY